MKISKKYKTPGVIFDRNGKEYDLTNKVAVSNDGEVLILPRLHKNKYIPAYFASQRPIQKDGHIQVSIPYNNKKLFVYVHRLVGFAWLKREPYQNNVLHKDDNPTNNHYKNLKWGTQLDNMHDMIDKNRSSKCKNKISNKLMLHIYQLGRGDKNMKPRHIHELYPKLNKQTIYPFISGKSKRLKKYLAQNFVN